MKNNKTVQIVFVAILLSLLSIGLVLLVLKLSESVNRVGFQTYQLYIGAPVVALILVVIIAAIYGLTRLGKGKDKWR